uniref:Nuclear receptor domain-containing protein n=1 Tax=Heterorhabditis bacteriophora TaxID=37862 RepID=A0A1I7XKJ1_HETBA
MTTQTSSASQPEELCLVCQDISTGYHYGVPSCNGCLQMVASQPSGEFPILEVKSTNILVVFNKPSRVTFRISPESADSELRCSVKGCVIGMISPGCRTSTGLLSIEDYPRSRRCRPVNTPRTREIVKNKIILDDER